MYRFINGEIDVLVSTTIIETGLDISNVNTMIIHDADKPGLSQLYQLGGGWAVPTGQRMLFCCIGEIRSSGKWLKAAVCDQRVYRAGLWF